MAELRPIKTPLAQHWRRVRYQMIPVLTFCGVLLVTGWLWRHHQSLPHAVGEVEAVRIPVRASYDGLLAHLDSGPLRLFDDVQIGQAVARLDDGPAQAALQALRQEIEALKGELAAVSARAGQEESDRAHDRLRESRRLALDVEDARLAILSLQTELQGDKVQLGRLTKLLAEAEKARQAGGVTMQTVVDLTLRRDETEVRIRGNTQAMTQAEANLASAQQRLKDYPTPPPAEVDVLLEPIRKTRAAQEARARELELQIATMAIRSPIAGKVCAILRHPGQAVEAGDDILMIAADRGRHIVTYVREYDQVRPRVGMVVSVKPRNAAAKVVQAHVLRIGPQVEAVPPHQCADPARLEWGLPVLISVPEDADLRPGELVDIAFTTS